MTRAFRAFGLVVAIETDDARLFPLLETQLPAFPEARAEDRPDLAYRVVAARGGVAVIRGRRTIALANDVPAASVKLVTDLQAAMARRAAGLTFVHAGVVAVDGRALLLPARSHAGKSTLVAALVAAGASYGSDEFAVIDARGRVHPYSRQLALRTPDASVARVRADALGDVLTDPVPVGAVLFTAFRPGATVAFARLSPGETVLRLIEHCLAARGRPDDTLGALQALAGAAPGFATPRAEAGPFARDLLGRVAAGWA